MGWEPGKRRINIGNEKLPTTGKPIRSLIWACYRDGNTCAPGPSARVQGRLQSTGKHWGGGEAAPRTGSKGASGGTGQSSALQMGAWPSSGCPAPAGPASVPSCPQQDMALADPVPGPSSPRALRTGCCLAPPRPSPVALGAAVLQSLECLVPLRWDSPVVLGPTP